MSYSRPSSSRGRGNDPDNHDENDASNPIIPLATSRLLPQPLHQAHSDHPPPSTPPAAPIDPNAPVQLGSSTPIELGVFPGPRWLEEFTRIRRQGQQRSELAAPSSSARVQQPELAGQVSTSTGEPRSITATSAPPGEPFTTMNQGEDPDRTDLETLRTRVLAEIDAARRSLESADFRPRNGPREVGPGQSTPNNPTYLVETGMINSSTTEPTDPHPASNLIIPGHTTSTSTSVDPDPNHNPTSNPDPNSTNPSRTYRWMDILTLEEAPTRYAMEYQRAYESLLQGIRVRVARDSDEVEPGGSGGASAGADAGAGDAPAANPAAADQPRSTWSGRPTAFENDDDDDDESEDDDEDEDDDDDDDDNEDEEETGLRRTPYGDSETDSLESEGEYERLLERMRNPFSTSTPGPHASTSTNISSGGGPGPGPGRATRSFPGSLSADLVAAEQEGRPMTVFQPTIVGNNPGMHRAHPLLIPSGELIGDDGDEERMDVYMNEPGVPAGGQDQEEGEGGNRGVTSQHHHHHVVVPHTHHHNHHHHHHHHHLPRAQASAQASSSSVPNGSSRHPPATSTHAPSCPLTRTKSVKRRKLDPSSKNPYTWIPSSMTHPIPKIPTAFLPEYMRISRLPIRSIPTSLNRADCAARLLLTPDLSTTSDDHTTATHPLSLDREPLLAVSFVGNGAGDDHDAAAVRADHPIPSTSGVFYYEVEIASKGRDGYISIGFCSRWTDLNRLVGWERESWGWHMDDGYIFESRGEGTNRGWPTSTTGDTIGCGIDFTTGKAFFTKNSVFVGEAFGGLQDKGRLYPAVGLRTPGEKLLVNFQGPFKYDIVSHVKRVQRWVQTSVKTAPVYMHLVAPPSETVGVDVAATTATESTEPAIATTTNDSSTLPEDPSSNRDKDTGLADKIHTCPSCSDSPAPTTYRKKLVTDIDSSLSSSILEYLRSGGYVDAARGMESVLNRRQAGGIEAPEKESNVESDMQVDGDDQKVDLLLPKQTEEERRVILLKSCRDAYAKGDLDLALSFVFDPASRGLNPSNPESDLSSFLSAGNAGEDRDNIWAFRFRMRHFYHCFLNHPIATHPELSPVIRTKIDEFFYGSDSPFNSSTLTSNPTPPAQPEPNETHRTLSIGRHIQAKHGSSSSPEIMDGLKVFGVMAYEDIESVPDRLKRGMTDASRKKEAGRLFNDLRVHMGYPAMNKIEQAYRQTSHTLLELGVLHTSAEAAFLEVPK